MSKKYFSRNKNIRYVLSTSVVVTSFAAFTLGIGHAFAEENEQPTETQVEETIQQDQTIDIIDATTQESATDVVQVDEVDEVKKSEPVNELTETEPVDEPTTELETDDEVIEDVTSEESQTKEPSEEDASPLLPGDFFSILRKN